MTTLLTAALTALEESHRHGHTCTDGKWYNPNAGTRTPCLTLGHVRTARDQAHLLEQAVHTAAHTPATAYAVGLAAAGYTAEQVEDLDADVREESRAGILQMGRAAIERLAEALDRRPTLDPRAAATAARLTRPVHNHDGGHGLSCPASCPAHLTRTE